MTARWTREAIVALGPTIDVQTAASVLDCCDWTIYEQIRRGTWELTRVLRLGRKIRIPTWDLIVLLFPTPDTSERQARQPAAATTKGNTDAPGPQATREHVRLHSLPPAG